MKYRPLKPEHQIHIGDEVWNGNEWLEIWTIDQDKGLQLEDRKWHCASEFYEKEKKVMDKFELTEIRRKEYIDGVAPFKVGEKVGNGCYEKGLGDVWKVIKIEHGRVGIFTSSGWQVKATRLKDGEEFCGCASWFFKFDPTIATVNVSIDVLKQVSKALEEARDNSINLTNETVDIRLMKIYDREIIEQEKLFKVIDNLIGVE